MGLLSMLRETLRFKSKRPPIAAKCPKCKAPVDTSMERCPKCGTHIESMFRLQCPDCKTANEIKNERCSKCSRILIPQAPSDTPRSPSYLCPICNYKADFYMLSCPSCGARFS
jgi:DNA-directed RNA polymerase subunit RPC12/RpoP